MLSGMLRGRRVTAKEETEMRPSDYYLKINDKLYIDAAPVNSCYARYANDNKDVPNGNNSKFEKFAHHRDSTQDKCYIVAIKDIKVDEEIFVSYGEGYWNDRPDANNPKMREFESVVLQSVSSSASQPHQQNQTVSASVAAPSQEPEEQKEEHPQGLRRSKRHRKK